MLKKIFSFLKHNKKGQSIMEYGMIVILVGIPLMTTFLQIRNGIGRRAFQAISTLATEVLVK